MEKGKSKMKLRSSCATHCPSSSRKMSGQGEEHRLWRAGKTGYWRHLLSKGISNPTHTFFLPTTVGIITIICHLCVWTHTKTQGKVIRESCIGNQPLQSPMVHRHHWLCKYFLKMTEMFKKLVVQWEKYQTKKSGVFQVLFYLKFFRMSHKLLNLSAPHCSYTQF